MTDILDKIDVQVACELCGDYTISAGVIAESQDLLAKGCPGSSYECPAELFAGLVEPPALHALAQAWREVERSVQRRTDALVLGHRLRIGFRGALEERADEPGVAGLAPTEDGPAYDLAAVARELLREEAYEREGHTARTLVRAPDLRVVLVAIKRGEQISEHHANATAVVQTISGHVGLQLSDTTVELPAGRTLALERGARHAVQASVDSVFLLTLGWRSKRKGQGADR